MNVQISPNSILNPKENRLWPGAISSLMRLQEAGFRIHLSGPLPADHLILLKNEGIIIHDGSPGKSAFSVDVDGDRLTINRENGPGTEADGWKDAINEILCPARTIKKHRKTHETDISLMLNLDGNGSNKISTGLAFFDHMLEQIARHGNVDLHLTCKGDLHVDEHHTIEDCAIVLGEAISEALGDKRGIERYAFVLPMDESRASVSLDLSGRPYLVFEGGFSREKVGDFPTEMARHFFYSLAIGMKATLHIEVTGENDHHKIEACFKGFAKTLREAVRRTGGNKVPSSKGSL